MMRVIKPVSRKLVVIVILLILLTAVQVVAAQDTAATAVVNSGALNVRSGPSVEYERVATIYQGQPVAVIGRFTDNAWVKIRLTNGQEGWVNSFYLIMSVPVYDLPVIGIPQELTLATVTAPAVNVRTGPGLDYPSIAIQYQGQVVRMIGWAGAGTWVKVRLGNGVEGWINSTVLQVNMSISDLPVAPVPLPPPGTDPPVAVPPVAGPVGYVTVEALNVRSGPGTQYGVISAVTRGEQLMLIGRSGDNYWLRIQTPTGTTGWVGSAYVLPSVSMDSLPVIDGSGSPVQPSQPIAVTAVISVGALNVRSGPGTGYAPSAVVFQGESVSVIGRNSASTWIKIQLNDGRTGWVYAPYTQVSVNIANLPVVG